MARRLYVAESIPRPHTSASSRGEGGGGQDGKLHFLSHFVILVYGQGCQPSCNPLLVHKIYLRAFLCSGTVHVVFISSNGTVHLRNHKCTIKAGVKFSIKTDIM